MSQGDTNPWAPPRWRSYLIYCLLLGLVTVSLVAHAQTSTGTIQGLITDSSGAVVPAAKVTVTNVRTNEKRELTTDSLGRYVTLYLLPGTYVVRVEKEGFRPVRSAEVTLNVGQNRSVDLVLEIGTLAQEVRVEAAPPPVDLSTSSVGQVIEYKRITDLPLNGRSVFSLVALTPGVNTAGGGTTPQMGGGRSTTSDILIDGATAVFPGGNPGLQDQSYEPQVDAVDEFNVQVNSLSAEYGRFGGGIINVAMKSGTNQLHGSAYDFLRNSKLDANSWAANRAGIKKGSFKRNQWGGTVGGPVYLPGIYDGRDKTFFFVGFEGTNPRSQSIYTATVPSPEWKAGDFSTLRDSRGAPVTIFDPLTIRENPENPLQYIRSPFEGNRIPRSRMSPVALNYIKYYPEANTRPVNPYTLSQNFVVAATPINDSYRLDPRVDRNWAPWWRMFIRASGTWNKTRSPMYFGNVATPGSWGERKGVQASFDHTFPIRPNLIANLRYGINRFRSFSTTFSDGFDLTQLGFPKYYDDVAAIQGREIPTVSISGVSSLGGGGWNRWKASASLVHMVSGSVTKILGRHTLKFGGEYRKLLRNQEGNLGYSSGEFGFAPAWTQRETTVARTTEGFGFASFLLGLPSSGSLPHGTDPASASSYFAGYIQHDWKLTSKLTLNLGLRYDVDVPRTDRFDNLCFFLLDEPSPLAGKVPATACPSCGDLRGAMGFVGGKNRRQAPTDWNNLGPRIGLAYGLSSKRVIRAAYGISYAPSALQAAAVGGDGGQAFQGQTSFIGTRDMMRTIYATLSDPYPHGFNFPPGRSQGAATFLGLSIGSSLFDAWKVPYIQQWNSTIQQALPGNMVAEIGYIGSRGIGLVDGDGTVQYNQLPASYMALGPRLTVYVQNPFYGLITNPQSSLSQRTVQYRQLIRPYPQYESLFSTRKPRASSIYHALIARLDKRFSNGFSLLVSYTAGKLIDDASQAVTYLGQVYGSKLDAYNLRLERAVSSVDVAQRLVLSYVYELPFGRGRRFWGNLPKAVDAFVGGWQISGITTFQSGLPLIVKPLANNTYIFSGQRPNSEGRSARLTGGTTNERLARWFDTSAFSQPPNYTFGNLGRTVPDCRNPGTKYTDLGIFKNLYLPPERRITLQYRVEMFGAFNTPQWGQPGNTIGSGTFGVITSASGARQIQMALKLLW